MQTHFTKSINGIDGKTSIFHFNRVIALDRFMYQVSVRTPEGEPIYFMMEMKQNSWFFKNSSEVPSWVLELEPQLATTISGKLSL